MAAKVLAVAFVIVAIIFCEDSGKERRIPSFFVVLVESLIFYDYFEAWMVCNSMIMTTLRMVLMITTTL